MSYKTTAENENSNFNNYFNKDKLLPCFSNLIEQGHHASDRTNQFSLNTQSQDAVFAHLLSLNIQIGSLLKADFFQKDLTSLEDFFKAHSLNLVSGRFGVILIGFAPTHALLASWYETTGIDYQRTISLHKVLTCPLNELLALTPEDKLEGFISPKLLIMNSPDVLTATLIRTSNLFRKFCKAVDSSIKNPRTVYDYSFYIPFNQSFTKQTPVLFPEEPLPVFLSKDIPEKKSRKPYTKKQK